MVTLQNYSKGYSAKNIISPCVILGENTLGKLSTEALRNLLRFIKKTPELIVPPMPGFDAGVHKLGEDMCVVIATDPCLGVPREWFGWLLIHYSASDVALFGAKPRFCAINLLGPPRTRKEVFEKVMKQASAAAEEIGMNIVTGHTGTYEGLSKLLATCTAYGFVQKNELITPAGAQPGDYLLCVKPVGLETLVNFAITHKKLARKLFGPELTRQLSEQVKMQTCVKEALTLARTGGVSAMHDATEGGLVAALNEIADVSKVGFSLDFAKLPLIPETQKLAGHFRLTWKQILSMSSTGTLLAAVSPHKKDGIMEILSGRGFDAKIVGFFSESKERLIKYRGREISFPRSAEDPYAKIFASEG
jgi:hydrogenase maturation factor